MKTQQISIESNNQGTSTCVPLYIRLPKSGTQCPLTGLVRSSYNALILPTAANNYRPPVKSVVLKSRNAASRGVRLILVESLKIHLASLTVNQTTAE